MFKFNNTHIFTGYLKQLLSSFNLPSCRIYTREFAKYLELHGTEDPRVLPSFDTLFANSATKNSAVRINYLKNNELYYYFTIDPKSTSTKPTWKRSSEIFYNDEKSTRGLTRNLNSSGSTYDSTTHEYLGDYLRFLRDYYNINLMSMYNCFNNKIYNNIYLPKDTDGVIKAVIDSQDTNYRLYAVPVKLFAEYTIAIDCDQGIELFCGLYNTKLDTSNKAKTLINKTYKKVNKTLFSQPFLFDKLSVKYWTHEQDLIENDKKEIELNTRALTRWEIAGCEQDLKLFIRVPSACRSSIVILEGDFRGYNDSKYEPRVIGESTIWDCTQNHSVLNFENGRNSRIDLNDYNFKPISKLQLLALNTGESYPFADRLVEYLSGSAITPLEQLPDNIMRAQKVMEQNKNYFQIDGLWENKMQNIIYDYIINSGPIRFEDGKLRDKRQGTHPRLGHTSKSLLYDVLGYVDKDAEKWYASWKKVANKNGKVEAQIIDNIQNVDIYGGLYDI